MKARKFRGTPGEWTLRLMYGDGKPFIEAPKVKPKAGYNIEVFGAEDANYPEEMRDADFQLGSCSKEMLEILIQLETRFKNDLNYASEYGTVRDILDKALKDITPEKLEVKNKYQAAVKPWEDWANSLGK